MRHYIIIIIFSIITASLLLYTNQKPTIYPNIHVNIGNFFCVYFFNMGKSFVKGNDYITSSTLDILPKKVILNNTIREQLVQNNFTLEELDNEALKHTPEGMWFICNDRRFLFWKIMKPQVHDILTRVLHYPKTHENVIIHFRCSDVPFQRHHKYMLQRFAYFDDILKRINVNHRNIIIVSCNDYRANHQQQTMCKSIIERLRTHLTKSGYYVQTRCSSILDDFAFMFSATAVISTGGSFSFMSGFFGATRFFSEGHYRDGNENCTICSDWLVSGYSIPHSNISNYFDKEDVFNKLLSN